MNRLTPRKLVWQICVALLLILLNAFPAASQDKRAKVRISNAGFTITALPLLAAKDWGVFSANGLDVELIVMSPSLAAAASATDWKARTPYLSAIFRAVSAITS